MPIPVVSSNSLLSVVSVTKDVKVLDERHPQVDVYNTALDVCLNYRVHTF